VYTRFFGFQEKPFQLVPNPAYLYLSRSHEEALAHLAYAVEHGDGFVAVTGEVGTGKTTLCRSFLENLDSGVSAAYIFNPKLDAVQLLQSINAEFDLPAPPGPAPQVKELIDILNTFLMSQKKSGRRVVILIDEAQNLNRDVLEQLRLISNLETTQSKLVQIVLVGQPELDMLLKSGEMRQLSQRINLRTKINPLAGQEIPAYIQHRLEVASGGDPLARFQAAALRHIARATGGTPRLINILCDRCLLAAYGHNQFVISSAMVRSAIHELIQQGYHGFAKRPQPRWIMAVAGVALAGLIWVALEPLGSLISAWRVPAGQTQPVHHPGEAEQPAPVRNESPPEPVVPPAPASTIPVQSEASTTIAPPPPAQEPPQTVVPKIPAATAPALPHLTLAAYLAQSDTLPSRESAMDLILHRWRSPPHQTTALDDIQSTYAYFRVACQQNGLKLTRTSLEAPLLAALNLPAILAVREQPADPPGYLVLAGMEGSQPLLSDGQVLIDTSWEALAPYWRGTVYIPWENFLGYADVVSEQSAPEAVLNLKLHLREIGLAAITLNPVYDDQTRESVARLQEKHGLPVDGVVGPLTKMVLYNLGAQWRIPRLDERLPTETKP